MKGNKYLLDDSLDSLGDAWNKFIEYVDDLYMVDKDDIEDFRKAIHDAQRIIYTMKYKSKKK